MGRNNNFELDRDEFPVGSRVELHFQDEDGNWLDWIPGTVVESYEMNDRAIEVVADEKRHDNLEYYGGHGIHVMVYCRKRSDILQQIRYSNDSQRSGLLKWLYYNLKNTIARK